MDQELLHKYFRADSTQQETEQILRWVEASQDNLQTFIRERNFWNTLQLQSAKSVDLSTGIGAGAAGPGAGAALSTKRGIRKLHLPRLQRWVAVAAVLVVLAGAFLIYTNNRESYTGQQQVYVPAGQRTGITLPDGTTVWLNSNTTFSYDSGFGVENRTVRVNGEAFFKVTKDADRPFIVLTDKSKVEVLGTVFNVHDYKGYDYYVTSVVEGAVKVTAGNGDNNEFQLAPGQKVTGNRGDLKKMEYIAGTDSWTKGVLVFEDELIRNVLNRLSAYYNVTIIMQNNQGDDYRCTAKFLYNDGLDYILRILQKDIHFTIVEDKTTNTVVLK